MNYQVQSLIKALLEKNYAFAEKTAKVILDTTQSKSTAQWKKECLELISQREDVEQYIAALNGVAKISELPNKERIFLNAEHAAAVQSIHESIEIKRIMRTHDFQGLNTAFVTGMPGSGKSSFIQAVAVYTKYTLVEINTVLMDIVQMDMDALGKLFQCEKCILVLKDIDKLTSPLLTGLIKQYVEYNENAYVFAETSNEQGISKELGSIFSEHYQIEIYEKEDREFLIRQTLKYLKIEMEQEDIKKLAEYQLVNRALNQLIGLIIIDNVLGKEIAYRLPQKVQIDHRKLEHLLIKKGVVQNESDAI